MEMKRPRVLILTGDGINCDFETKAAFEKAGASAERVHINTLLREPEILMSYEIFCIPGGFSFGDDLGSGRVLALKLKHGLGDAIKRFREKSGLILGICNGFQVLVKMGVLNSSGSVENEQDLTLTLNTPEGFVDKWVTLRVNPKTSCIWTKGLDVFELPIRHGEGRLVLSEKVSSGTSEYVSSSNMVLSYSEDVNGSVGQSAGICDKSGRVFGLMPHPEAFQDFELGKSWTRHREQRKEKILGLAIFRNGVNEAKRILAEKEDLK